MEKYIHKIQYYETDKMQITHHSNYIRFMEEARVNFLENIGCGYQKLEENGLVSPVVSVSCDFKTQSTFGDEIEIEVTLSEYSGVRIAFEYQFINHNTKAIVATGKTKHCFINKNGRPINIKKEIPKLDEILNNLIN